MSVSAICERSGVPIEGEQEGESRANGVLLSAEGAGIPRMRTPKGSLRKRMERMGNGVLLVKEKMLTFYSLFLIMDGFLSPGKV